MQRTSAFHVLHPGIVRQSRDDENGIYSRSGSIAIQTTLPAQPSAVILALPCCYPPCRACHQRVTQCLRSHMIRTTCEFVYIFQGLSGFRELGVVQSLTSNSPTKCRYHKHSSGTCPLPAFCGDPSLMDHGREQFGKMFWRNGKQDTHLLAAAGQGSD